jgi:hypothetical protein
VSLGPQALHLFLQSQLLSLQALDPITIGGRPGQFVLDGAFEGLVTHSEFANASFDGHDRKAPVLTTGKVNTSDGKLSDHIWLRGVAGASAPKA